MQPTTDPASLCWQCGERRPRRGSDICHRCRDRIKSILIDYAHCVVCGKLFAFRPRIGARTYCRDLKCIRKLESAKQLRKYYSSTEIRERWNERSSSYRRIIIDYLMDRDGSRCGICGKPIKVTAGPMRPSIDHIVPRSEGGADAMVNLQATHYRCNLSKNKYGGGEQLRLIG